MISSRQSWIHSR